MTTMTTDRSASVMTANQVVAYNLVEARAIRQWTQKESALALRPYLGVLWSKGTFSAAERSVDGSRVRQFTADEIVAFARAFNLPIGWFFMPPSAEIDGRPVMLSTPDSGPDGTTPSELVDVVFGYGEGADYTVSRLDEYLQDLGGDRLAELQSAVRQMAQDRVDALVRAFLSPLPGLASDLRAVADALESFSAEGPSDLSSDIGGQVSLRGARPFSK